MAERLADIEARIGSVRQLSSVIGAMRGIAAARLREAQQRLEGIRAHAATVAEAIAEVQAAIPASARPAGLRKGPYRLVIALGGEQGFTGRYDEGILEAALKLADEPGNLLLVGDRIVANAAERGLTPWRCLPMAAHADEVLALAGRIVDELYGRLTLGRMPSVFLVHAQPEQPTMSGIVQKRLLPFDFARFASAASSRLPLVNLPVGLLLERLSEEYVFAEICEALTLAHAAENEARMRAMIAARGNVDTRLEDLTAAARRLRQEAITSEVTELAAAADC